MSRRALFCLALALAPTAAPRAQSLLHIPDFTLTTVVDHPTIRGYGGYLPAPGDPFLAGYTWTLGSFPLFGASFHVWDFAPGSGPATGTQLAASLIASSGSGPQMRFEGAGLPECGLEFGRVVPSGP